MKKANQGILFNEDSIRDILTKAQKFKDSADVAKEINEVVNCLCVLGYYDFNEFLVE
jgi:hypothetical protein